MFVHEWKCVRKKCKYNRSVSRIFLFARKHFLIILGSRLITKNLRFVISLNGERFSLKKMFSPSYIALYFLF